MKNTSRTPYIYKVTNQETGQYYIGSQCSGKTVGVNYFTSSTDKEFREGFKNYGEEKYKIEIIKEFIDSDECVRVENYMIRDHMLLKDGLCVNRAYHCNGEKIFSTVGTHHSEETKQKLSKAHKGRHPSEESRKRMSRAQKGRHHSDETRKRISEAEKGRHHSEESRKRMSRAQKGIQKTEETKKRMSLAKKNRIKISVEGIVFGSLVDASKYYNVSVTAIRKWAKKNQHDAFYIEK